MFVKTIKSRKVNDSAVHQKKNRIHCNKFGAGTSFYQNSDFRMDQEIFRQYIIPLRDKLYRFALRITGSSHEAEDVVQEVMENIWKAPGNQSNDTSQKLGGMEYDTNQKQIARPEQTPQNQADPVCRKQG
jgi:hypothetical protein